MEVNGMSSTYASYLTNQAAESNKASNLKDKLNAGGKPSSDEELMDVCKEFESYFLEKVFKAMMDTTKIFSDDKDSGDTYASKMVDYFKDSAVSQIASQATEQNGIGIATTLYNQMKRQYSAIKPEELE